jgi:hypothetical protein
MSGPDTFTALSEKVRRFQVCWEILPELAGTSHERRPIGFNVELYGTHDRPDTTPTAGCRHCLPVLHALLELAEFIVPDPWRDSLEAIRARSGLEYATERAGRPDVVVVVTVLPRSIVERELEASVLAGCRRDVEKRLMDVGAAERSWRQ